MYRSNAYNEGSLFSLIPVFRRQVVPGESCELDILAQFETPPFLGNIMSGGQASIYAFYCPHRLVWDQWVDFISDPDSGLTVPTTATSWPLLFDYVPNGGNEVSVLFRRAYKLAYNQFFGSEQFNRFYVVNQDSSVSVQTLRTNDQFLGRVMSNNDISDQDYEAPVSGTDPDMVATISLNAFRQAMQNAKQGRRAQMTGDKYVDAMLRLGVKLDWRVQMAPEFLGAAHIDFVPKDTRASYSNASPSTSGAANTGQSFSRFQETIRLKTKRKFFAEHGYIFACVAVRPFAFNEGFTAPADAHIRQYSDFFLGENNQGVREFGAGDYIKGAVGTLFTHKWEYLHSGHNMIGDSSTNPWVPTDNSQNVDNGIYPTPLDIPSTGQLENQMAVFARSACSSISPARRNTI